MRALDVVVAVPVAGVGLHEADALLNETSSEEAFASEGIGVFFANAIGFEGGFFFALEVENFGNLHLHAIGKFIRGHAGAELVSVGVGGEMPLVELGEEIEVLALSLTGDSGGRI